MKKLLILFLAMFFIVGCGCEQAGNSAKKQVDDLFYKYQTLHSSVAVQLDSVVDNESTFTDEQKKGYKEVMERQFKDLEYEIKDEIIDGNNAVVTVEIEVYDYGKVLKAANDQLLNHKEDFNDDQGNYSETKYNDYKIQQLKNAKEKITYTVNIDLTKTEKSWSVNSLNDITLKKIYGLYAE